MGPGGSRIGSVPANAALAAISQAPGWFNVRYHNTSGWISADYVTTAGDCGAQATDDAQAQADEPSIQTFSDCRVTTTHGLNLRDSAGVRIGLSAGQYDPGRDGAHARLVQCDVSRRDGLGQRRLRHRVGRLRLGIRAYCSRAEFHHAQALCRNKSETGRQTRECAIHLTWQVLLIALCLQCTRQAGVCGGAEAVDH